MTDAALKCRKNGRQYVTEQDLLPQILVCKRQLYFPSQANFSWKKQIIKLFSTSRTLEF